MVCRAMEFRFPKIGSITADGVELELRQALEPWNVLAEETTSGGTVRSVDSSLERIQVKMSGVTAESRYAVACNGRRVPLASDRRAGRVVCRACDIARGSCRLRCIRPFRCMRRWYLT